LLIGYSLVEGAGTGPYLWSYYGSLLSAPYIALLSRQVQSSVIVEAEKPHSVTVRVSKALVYGVGFNSSRAGYIGET